MRPAPLTTLAALVALLALPSACGSGAAPAPDAGSPDGAAPDAAAPPDAGADTVPDVAGLADAGAPPDAATDALSDAATDAVPDAAPPLPDPAFVYAPRTSAAMWEDTPVLEEVPTFYRTTDVLPDLDVRALLAIGADVWVGTPSGLFRRDGATDRFVAVPLDAPDPGVLDLAATPDGGLLVAHAGGVSLLSAAGVARFGAVPDAPVVAVAADGAQVLVATAAGVGTLGFEPPSFTLDWPGVTARDLLGPSPGAPLWAATAEGVVVLADPPRTLGATDGLLPDDDVRALASLADGRVLVATATGLAAVDGDGSGATLVRAGRAPGQLPTADHLAVAARDGLWAVGHVIGATVRSPDGARSDHYHSGRWVRAPRVAAVALGTDGQRWLGTTAGLTRIDLVPRTLEEKALFFEDFLEAHCWRMDGFVSPDVQFGDAWDQAQASRSDSDNDGLWTQMQVGAWSLAYGATGDPLYCERARRATRTMLLQIDIPAVDFEAAGLGRGFVTRSLVRDDEGALFASKASQSNWHPVRWTDGHDYYWKDDTSSDETAGHFFGYPLYFDLCADEAERAVIADRAGALAAYIIAHDFRLVDLDGQQTTHGEWYPELLAVAVDGIPACIQAGHPFTTCVGAASGHGWLNGTEILGHLLAAWHMTAEPRFLAAYERLVRDHRYDELVDFDEGILTVTDPAVANHSDHELAILAYFTLIRYEPDDERRARWIRSALAVHEWERPERNALWSFLIAGITSGAEVDIDAAAGTLHEIPLDLRHWPIDNGHRQDARRLVNDRHGDPQLDRVFPYDELRTVWWNGNLYGVEEGGDPRSAQCPMFYLLPYWGLRYFGALTGPAGER
jgi:hypothetical protein